MATVNKVLLLGNLTRDPEMKALPSGMAVCDLGMALNRSWTDKQSGQRKEEVTYVDVSCFGRTAEIAGEYLSKGRQVHIEGRLKLDQWEDKQTGQKRSKMRVVCDQLTLVGGREGGGGGGGGGGGYGGGQQRQQRPQQGGGQGGGGNQGGGYNQAPQQDNYGGSQADDYYADAPSGGGGQDFPDDEVPF